MTREEKKFIIDTLQNAIEWASYADEYFQKKHELSQDLADVTKSIDILNSLEQRNTEQEQQVKELQEPKMCSDCKFFLQRFTEEGYLKYNLCDMGVTSCHDKFYCSMHSPKHN